MSKRLLYARWDAATSRCVDVKRLGAIGQLPKIVVTGGGIVMVVGMAGFVVSHDGGATFSARTRHPFGEQTGATLADGDGIVVAFTSGQEVDVERTDDGGTTWRRTQVSTEHPTLVPAISFEPGPGKGRLHVVWIGPRDGGAGAVLHSYSDDGGASFSRPETVSDAPFVLHDHSPPPPPSTQDGTWAGDYIALTTIHRKVIAAWGDQRMGAPRSGVFVSIGAGANE
jgi:hypothetical protein